MQMTTSMIANVVCDELSKNLPGGFYFFASQDAATEYQRRMYFTKNQNPIFIFCQTWSGKPVELGRIEHNENGERLAACIILDSIWVKGLCEAHKIKLQ